MVDADANCLLKNKVGKVVGEKLVALLMKVRNNRNKTNPARLSIDKY